MNQNIVIAIIAGIIIVGGLILLLNSGDTDPVSNLDSELTVNQNSTTTPTPAPGTSTNITTPPTGTPTNSVTLAEHRDGNIATANATLREPGFIAVYRLNSQGATSFIGSSDKLDSGTHANVRIQLTTPLIDGETIVAVLYSDTNDNDRFDQEGVDAFMTLNNQMAFDVDVINVPIAEEDGELRENVETFLERTATSSAS